MSNSFHRKKYSSFSSHIFKNLACFFYRGSVTSYNQLPRSIIICYIKAIPILIPNSLQNRKNFIIRDTYNSPHCTWMLLKCFMENLSSSPYKLKCFLKIKSPRNNKCGIFAQRMTGHTIRFKI